MEGLAGYNTPLNCQCCILALTGQFEERHVHNKSESGSSDNRDHLSSHLADICDGICSTSRMVAVWQRRVPKQAACCRTFWVGLLPPLHRLLQTCLQACAACLVLRLITAGTPPEMSQSQRSLTKCICLLHQLLQGYDGSEAGLLELQMMSRSMHSIHYQEHGPPLSQGHHRLLRAQHGSQHPSGKQQTPGHISRMLDWNRCI